MVQSCVYNSLTQFCYTYTYWTFNWGGGVLPLCWLRLSIEKNQAFKVLIYCMIVWFCDFFKLDLQNGQERYLNE